jgi:hypothetical protein
MLSLKTTIAALIAALSVIATTSVAGAFIPQAFAQQADDNGNDDERGNTVNAEQSNSATFSISQSQSQVGEAETGSNDDDSTAATGSNDNKDDDGGTAVVVQSADQGFCIQNSQQNAAAGNDASNSASQTDFGTVTNSLGSTGKDCS